MMFGEEQKDQVQSSWLARLEHERRNLSRSVEETLKDEDTSDQHKAFWLDDEDGIEKDVLLKHDPVEQYQRKTGKGEGWAHANHKRTNIFIRFAQRLTTSLTAPNRSVRPPEYGNGIGPEVSTQEKPERFSAVQLAIETSQRETKNESVMPAAIPLQKTRIQETDGNTIREMEPDRQSLQDQVQSGMGMSVTPLPDTATTGQSRLRLAGRATRIRLETPSDMTAIKTEGISPPIPSYPGMLPDERHRRVGPAHPYITPEGQPENLGGQISTIQRRQTRVLPVAREEDDPTHPQLPALAHLRGGRAGTSARVVWGCAELACGQREAIIVNSSVTASSVVLVTLTGNPGPVVVQYVTLQPYIGFTVHLTAPTTVRTPFNYVILGELRSM